MRFSEEVKLENVFKWGQANSNGTDRIAYKIISNFQKSDLLVVSPNRYNVELSIKSVERLHHQANSGHENELISDRKVTKSFQSYLNNASNKTNKLTQKCLLTLSFFQTQVVKEIHHRFTRHMLL